MKEIRITEQEENQRLDKFLLKYMNKAPKGFLYKMLRKKRIKLNGGRAEGSELLRAGDMLQLYLAEETMDSFTEGKTLVSAARHFGIVYEDDDILVVSKPAGLLSHPEKSTDKDTLIDQILYYLYEKGQYTPKGQNGFTPALCNRLDRNTSGIVVAGKTLRGVQAVNETIRGHGLEKYYYALVAGEIHEAGEISGFLTKDGEKNQVRPTGAGGGAHAVTKYRPLRCEKGYTLLEILLVTGKTHQIRAHMQAIGHPIIGDRKYGEEKRNRECRREFALCNQFLHAGEIIWRRPADALRYLAGKKMTAPLPEPLQAVCSGIFGGGYTDSEEERR